MGSSMGSREERLRMLAMLTGAGLRPIIDSARPLQAAAAAMARMEAGEQFGEIVLKVE